MTLIAALVGAAIVFISTAERTTKIVSFVVLFIVYFIIGYVATYFGMPSLAYPLLGWYGGLIIFFWVISAVIGIVSSDEWAHSGWFPIVSIIIVVITAMSGCEACNSQKYSSLIGKIQDKTQRHWSQEIQPLDPTHIRLVPEELALSLARTALSQDGNTLGSQYPLSEQYCTLQKVNSDYWYLIPLDFKSYTVWTNSDGVPGYVRVSATDPYRKPELVTGKKFKFTPEACFGDNLERRLYEKYYNKILMDYSFEEDDLGNVYWVVTVCSPSIVYSGLVVEGVILFNPENGESEYIDQKNIEADAKYKWIDRVIPAKIVKDYVDYWGDLKGGWWNSFWTHINLLQAETPTMNYSDDGRCIFVTPVTSNNQSDQSMTGLMYADARSGKFTYYTTSGGATEEAIVQAVNSAISYKNWHGSEQIVYENVYGKMSGLVPILGQNGNYQGLALVENENKRVAIGTTPQEALIEYQKLLMSVGGQISTEAIKNTLEYTGIIKRLGWDFSGSGKQYYITVDNLKNSFMVSSNLQSELALTKEGDKIYIQYINSNQVSMPVMNFKNLTLSLQGSASEQSVIKQMQNNQETNQSKSDVKDFKEELKNMSDEQIKSLMKKK